MKAGFVTSLFAHVGILAWGVVSLATPPVLDVPDVEALPVDIVPIESITKTIEGAKKAKPSKKPAPKPTKSPPKPEPAKNAGDTKTDIKADAEEAKKAPPVEKTEAPTPKSEPTPKEKPKTVPTPELAPKPKPKTDIAALLKQTQEVEKTEPAEEAFEKLPEKVSKPKSRPTKPKPDTAQTNKREKDKKIALAEQKKAKKKKDDAAKKKAVVNKAKSNAGGAKSSNKKASLGTKKSNNATKLSQSEIDAVRGRLEGCWSVGDLTGHPDANKMRARVTFKLTPAGDIDGRVKVKVSGTDRTTKATLAVRVRAAVNECAPFQLPADKYETWSEVIVNFSLQDML